MIPPCDTSRHSRLLIVTNVPETISSFLIEPIEYAREAGFDIICACGDTPLVKNLRQRGLRVETLPIKRTLSLIHLLRTLVRMIRLLRKIRPDIVHSHTPIANLVAQVAAAVAAPRSVKRVCSIHGLFYVNQRSRFLRWLFLKLETFTARLSNSLICVNQEDRAVLARRLHRPEDRIAVLNVGINLSRFDPQRLAGSRDHMRSQLGIEDADFVFGIVSRVVREKGYLELFEAFEHVLKIHNCAKLVVVGPVDNSRRDGIDLDRSLNDSIKPAVIYLGKRHDVPELLSVMDCFVLPSHREGFPTAIMEASAMGLAIIASDIRGCREAVFDGRTGRLVPVNDASSLASAMLEMIEQKDFRKSCADNARELALKEFDRSKIARQTVKIYEKLLEPPHDLRR